MQGTNAAHLMDLQALALSLELPTYLVRDAGRTQVTAPGGPCLRGAHLAPRARRDEFPGAEHSLGERLQPRARSLQVWNENFTTCLKNPYSYEYKKVCG